MEKVQYLKTNLLLLLAIIPLSIIGYIFAVYEESLFFLYEWSLVMIVVTVIVLSVRSVVQTNGKSKWVPIAIAAFLIQFSVMGLFLGPLTNAALFVPFYAVSVIAITIFIMEIKKLEAHKWIPVTFFMLSCLFFFYMVLLNSLWGQDVSFVQ